MALPVLEAFTGPTFEDDSANNTLVYTTPQEERTMTNDELDRAINTLNELLKTTARNKQLFGKISKYLFYLLEEQTKRLVDPAKP